MASNIEFRGQFSVTSAEVSFGVGSNVLAMNTGDYYIAGYTGEAESQYVEDMQGQIRTIAGQGNANVKYNTNGRVTIELNAAQNITFDDSAVGSTIGFTNTALSSAAVHTADKQAKYVWRPSRGLTGYPIIANTIWQPSSSTKTGRSVDGTTFSTKGSLTYDADLSISHLPEADVITPDTGSVNQDLQQFFTDVVHEGMPIRVLPDRDVVTSSGYVTAIWGADADDVVGDFRKYASRTFETYNGLWVVTLKLIKKI